MRVRWRVYGEKKYFFPVKTARLSAINTGRAVYRLRKQHARHEHKCRHTRAPVQDIFPGHAVRQDQFLRAILVLSRGRAQGGCNFRRRRPFILTVRIGNKRDLARWRVRSVNNRDEWERRGERSFEGCKRSWIHERINMTILLSIFFHIVTSDLSKCFD